MIERGGAALQWEALRSRIAAHARSEPGRARVQALEPSRDLAWIGQQQARNAELRMLVAAGASFDFRGIFDPQEHVDKARIEGAALEPAELLAVLALAERAEAWGQMLLAPPDAVRGGWAAVEEMSAPLMVHEFTPVLRALRGKIEPDGTLSDEASPELARIRRAIGRQHRAIEESLRKALGRLSEDGSVQESLITIRGERFVIPVKVESRRKVQGVVHGSSSSGQTVFIEPMETIETNNELVRLLDEEQAEVHRILVAMTRAVGEAAEGLLAAADVLAEADAHQAIALFAEELDCVRPEFNGVFALDAARHPLLDLRLREQGAGSIVPLTIALPEGQRQMIVSGPNTGGKTVTLKTAGLLAIMAQAGVPVPAVKAGLPLLGAIYADVGDAQSIEQNLSTFSAHVTNVDRISRVADEHSLVLLDELGSATDPEEGAALAVAVARHFLRRHAWTFITTHLTALKVYAAGEAGVFNAAVGFDEETLSPTYDLRLGVPGASAGLNIAARLGLDPAIVAEARAQRTTQQADIARFLDELHAQLGAAAAERTVNAETAQKLENEREHLRREGRAEQQARTREMKRELDGLIEEFEQQVKQAVKAIDDKTVARKMARDSALRVAGLRREFSERFQSTVAAHAEPGAPKPLTRAERMRTPHVGDVVRLRQLGIEAKIERLVDDKQMEVSAGRMKMRVPIGDIVEIVAMAKSATETSGKRGGGVRVQSAVEDADYMTSEINVIGRTADEAEGEVDRFVEQAFLAGLPRIRVVHGVGMGILRRTLRDFLRKHPHVVAVTEPPYNEGGQGATIVELRQ